MNKIVHIFARESTIQFTDPTSGETRIVERRTPGEDAELIGNVFRSGSIYFGVKKVFLYRCYICDQAVEPELFFVNDSGCVHIIQCSECGSDYEHIQQTGHKTRISMGLDF